MNVPDIKEYITPGNLTIAGVAVVLVAWGVSSWQEARVERGIRAAAVAEAVAETRKSLRGEYEQQLQGKTIEISQKEEIARDWKRKLEIAKSKIPVPSLPPTSEPALASSLVQLGLGSELEVRVQPSSVLNIADAQVVWDLGQQSIRAKALDGALITCAEALQASEAVVKGQGEAIVLSSKALEQSKLEADARQVQAQELAKSLKIEKQKKWKLWAYPIAAAALTAWVVKK